MNKPLLLYITDAAALGGAEAYLETLLLHADKSRYRVVLALPPREATQPLVERARLNNVQIEYLDAVHHEGMNIRAVVRSHMVLRRLQPDIVHFVLASPRRCAESVLAAWLAQVPRRIATFQLVTPVPHFAGLVGVARSLNRSMQFRTLTKGIAVSQGNARLLVEQYGFPASRLAIIPNGVDTHVFVQPSDRVAIRNTWNIPIDVSLVGVVGRLSRQKGHRVLLAALPVVWAHFPNLHVAFIGSGEGEADLRAEAKRVDSKGRIHFLGQIEHDRMPTALGAIDIFALPSLYEGLPFAVVEAMAAARPIVATNVDGTREAIADQATGLLVPPGEPEPLAHALLRLLDNQTFREQLGRAAQAAAFQRFDQANMLQATFGLYTITTELGVDDRVTG